MGSVAQIVITQTFSGTERQNFYVRTRSGGYRLDVSKFYFTVTGVCLAQGLRLLLFRKVDGSLCLGSGLRHDGHTTQAISALHRPCSDQPQFCGHQTSRSFALFRNVSLGARSPDLDQNRKDSPATRSTAAAKSARAKFAPPQSSPLPPKPSQDSD